MLLRPLEMVSSARYLLFVVLCVRNSLTKATKGDFIPPKQCPLAKGMTFSYDNVATDGPDNWRSMSQCCSGRWQSPINIITNDCRCNVPHRIIYTEHPRGRIQGAMYNAGYAVNMDFSKTTTPALKGVPYWENEEYVFGSLHFHTGQAGQSSEHQVNGKPFDAELHMVHYKKIYGSIAEAVKHADGLAVIGIFITENDLFPNVEMERLITATEHTTTKKTYDKVLFDVDIRQLFPWNKDFYVYHGSLTTPSCSESVRWMVFKDPIAVSSRKINILRAAKMWDGSQLALKGNCRPIAPTYGRIVETNFNCSTVAL